MFLAAQAEGAGDKATAGIAARQGVVVAIILSIPLMAVIWNIGDIFLLLGQDPEIAALAEPYARALSPIAPAALIFAALRDFVAALARTRSIMNSTRGFSMPITPRAPSGLPMAPFAAQAFR